MGNELKVCYSDCLWQVMLDTVGAEMQVVNKSETTISLEIDAQVVLTPNQGQEASSEILPINFDGLAQVHWRFSPYHHYMMWLSCIYIYIWNWQNVLININTRTRCASTDTVNTKLQILHNLKTSHYTKLHHLLPPNINMKDFNFVAYGVYALTQFCCLCSACFESIFLSSQGCMAQISYKLCIYMQFIYCLWC